MSSGSLLGVSVLELRTDQGPLNRGLAQARVSADRTGAQMQATMDRRMVSMGQSMGRVGSTMTRSLTLPLVALAGASADLDAKFSQAMEMIHTQAGAPQREVGALRDQVLALARVVPQGPVALAQALFRIESVGLRGAKAMSALKASAELAAVGNASLDDTTKALVQTVFTGIKGIGSFQQVVALLNATVGAGDMHLSDLVDALGQGILPSAKIAGLGLKDVLGAVAVFGDETKNVAGWTAQFATALHFLTTPTSKASTALNAMGLQTDQLAQDMHKPNGLLVALKDLRSHLDQLPGGANGVKAEQALNSILPGGRGRVLLVLLNQLDRYQQKLGQISRTTNQFAGDVAKTQQTSANKIKVAWSNLEVDAVDFGHKVLPELLTVGQAIVSVVDKAATAFSKLPKGMQDTIIGIGLVVAATGPLLKVVGAFERSAGLVLGAAKVAGRFTGLLPALSKVAGGSGLTSSVATMEVGTLIAKSMVGGGGGLPGGGSGLSTAEKDAVKAAEGAGTGGGIIAGLKAVGMRVGGKVVPLLAEDGSVAALVTVSAATLGTGAIAAYLAANGASPNLHQLLVGLGLAIPNPKVGNPAVTHPQGIFAPGTPSSVRQASLSQQQITHDTVEMDAALSKLERKQSTIKETIANLAKLAKEARTVGDTSNAMADTLGGALLKTHSASSKQVQAVVGQLNKLAPAARTQATLAMARMSQALETAGKVPVGTTAKLMGEMLNSYQGMKDGGLHQFNQLFKGATTIAQNLRYKIAHSTGQTRDDALAALHQLQQGSFHLFSQMQTQSGQKIGAMSYGIRHGSASAANTATGAFTVFEDNVYKAMSSGVLSSRQGAQLINQELAAALKAFGGQDKVAQGALVATTVGLTQPPKLATAHAARGAMFQIGRPGEAGHDTVPMSIGGTKVVVGRGETAMIANRHQRPEMEMWAREHGYAGLDDFFAKRDRPNYMAAGGIVTASTYTGSGGAYGPPHPGSIARLQSGGGWFNTLAPLSHWKITGPSGRTIDAQVTDWGSGGGGIGGHPRAVDLWSPGTTGELGVPGNWLGLVNIGGGAIPPGATAAAWKPILPPHVTGGGAAGEIVQLALNKETAQANKYGAAHMPVLTATAGPTSGPSGTSIFQGIPVANWIIPVLQWAQQHGWGGQVTSGYRPGFDPSAPSGSEHALTQYPGGAIDVGDPAAIAAGTALYDALKPYPGPRKLLWGGIYITGYVGPGGHDYGHFSGTGHARGGIIDEFARGGMLGLAGGGLTGGPSTGRFDHGSRQRGGVGAATHGGHGKKYPKNRKRPPHPKHRPSGFYQPPTGPMIPPKIKHAVSAVNDLLGGRGDVAKLQDIYQQTDNMFQTRHPNLQYVVTQDKLGNSILPYIDWEVGQDGWPFPDLHSKHAVNLSLGELTELHGWQYRMVHDYQEALKILSPLVRWIKQAIEKRKKRVEKLKRKIRENLKKIKALTAQIKKENVTGTGSNLRSTKSGTHLSSAQKAATGKRIKGWQHEISDLKLENTKLGGSSTTVGSGGVLGRLGKELSVLHTQEGTAMGNQLQVAGASGHGGDLGSAQVQLVTLNQQINELSPSALKAQLRAADASFTASSNQQLNSDLQALLLQDAQTIALQNAEIGVLNSPVNFGTLPPFGGSFATGGVVPGLLGEPRTIIAHGGETVIPSGGGDVDVKVRVEDQRVRVWVDDVERIVDGRLRTISRNAGRGLPGRGGGR